ncbi:branched-chain alpha-keto acid lipoamide acyltransferase [Purpureocillium lavendulum]|uniref:Lipoamide acyltransferase component of branched-chain alpha-keto acid dehydrogenase complex, mitochondrial n=1 Tax=Purpureocillium lavendulum TaxID=1247861 RepID=A0AB34G419_9HYPO|nr:branched-chain alpha-keto acid lipoamide acyltransferase [Purpureocillium lavendulum]
MASLPLEIVEQIIRHLQQPWQTDLQTMHYQRYYWCEDWNACQTTVKNMRLVCRLFHDLASPLLFPYVALGIDQESLDHVERIARRPRLAAGVRGVLVDRRYRCPWQRDGTLDFFLMQVTHKLSQFAEECFSYEPEYSNDEEEQKRVDLGKRNFPVICDAWGKAAFVEPQYRVDGVVSDAKEMQEYVALIERAHKEFRRRQEEQTRLLDDGTFLQSLVSALSRMPHLDTMDIGGKVDLMRKPSDDFHWVLASKDELERFITRRFRNTPGGLPLNLPVELPIAAVAAGIRLRHLTVRCPEEGTSSLPLPTEENAGAHGDKRDSLQAATQTLETVYLFVGTREEERQSSFVDQYASAVTSGESLRGFILRGYATQQLGRLNRTMHGHVLATANWPRLKKLHIHFTSITRREFAGLCDGLGDGSLEDLDLYYVFLTGGCWADVLDKLRDKMSTTSGSRRRVRLLRIWGCELGETIKSLTEHHDTTAMYDAEGFERLEPIAAQRAQRQLRATQAVARVAAGSIPKGSSSVNVGGCMAAAAPRWFSESRRLCAVKPVLLADIGEGIVECEVIQWFVEPGARVEEFSPLCEVQSDKASVEITSRFAGTVKKLYYDAGEMAKVGKPFVDIDIEGDDAPAATPAPTQPDQAQTQEQQQQQPPPPPPPSSSQQQQQQPQDTSSSGSTPPPAPQSNGAKPKGKMATLATPAVRHLSKELDVDIADIDGTGKDGRVLKEDIYKFVQGGRQAPQAGQAAPAGAAGMADTSVQTETREPLSQVQQMMFKSMTRSLNIPHFLYADEIDMSDLVSLRARLNKVLASPGAAGAVANGTTTPAKLSYLPFIIKAVSLALYQFPILNARVEVDAATGKPALIKRSQHNIGVAMDAPNGLVVPVIKNVGALNIVSIAAELVRLQGLAHAGKLTPADMSGGTITVSNIGNIGGTYLSPVIVEREVAILGIGRMRTVPAFDDQDNVVKKHVCNFSWSADHRVVDGATMARAAEVVRRVVEEPDVMVMHLR